MKMLAIIIQGKPAILDCAHFSTDSARSTQQVSETESVLSRRRASEMGERGLKP